jgi:hypothetical protein
MGTVSADVAGVVMPIETGSTVIVALAELGEGVTGVAVMVTGPDGIMVGAVYVINPALAVWLGLDRPDCNDPQAPAAVEPQLRLQLAPAALPSLLTVAANAAVPLTPKKVGA